MYTVGGKWGHEGERWTPWCEGFFPSMLWMIYGRTNDPWWYDQAVKYTERLEPRKMDRTVHDLGFIFMNTYRRWYGFAGDPRLRDIIVQAGRTLALRFKEKGEYLCSFIGPESLFIDIMMNIEVILYAAEQLRDNHLKDIAVRHALTTRRYLVREDGSTAHEGIFDTETGMFLRQSTHQGLRPDSCWARGLAWAIYGFGTTYRYTQDTRFLETAERCATYYLRRVPEGGVPYWDFDIPAGPARIWDSSAGAIAASGLWNLAELTRSETYRRMAVQIVETLASDEFLAETRADWEGILLHGVYHFHKKLGVDESVIWGDHFFLEALLKLLS
jgi:unsaturated chondroitin disaccharide hydrolase